ncbi:MAG: dipicolinate synthase subunit DpsA [Clostridia bacterium]|nr:dipicolinate synthase subunit DpsA [Clostridia bacterium]
MIRDIKIAVIGGDKRQRICAKELENKGFSVDCYGVSGEREAEKLEKCLENATVVLLPLPYGDIMHISTDCDVCITAERIFSKVHPNRLVLAGKADTPLVEKAKQFGIRLIDYFEREDLNILNAVPTAEGALELAMRETDITVHGTNAVILGYGRIGKILAKYLDALGANVHVGARKPCDLAMIYTMGYTPFDIKFPQKYVSEAELIFNTVPKLLFNRELLEKVKSDALIIDLASKPGGVDRASAKELEKKVIWALSLPGKVAPVSSGKIIAKTVESILKEEGYV